jgi:Uma2 family endonuclease
MASTTLVSLDEYLTTVYDPDREYVDGELIERNMGEADHAGLQGILTAWLFSQRKALGIHVFPELRLQVAPKRYRIPDVAVTTTKIQGRVMRKPPLLCIEVLSPEDRASRLEDKIDDYLRFGVQHIWVIDPCQKCAWSYTSEGKREAVTVLRIADPKIELPLSELFRELEESVEEA